MAATGEIGWAEVADKASVCPGCGRPVAGFAAFRSIGTTWGGRKVYERLHVECAEEEDWWKSQRRLLG